MAAPLRVVDQPCWEPICTASTSCATADAIVYATAVQHGADLLTCDAHFEGLPGVILVPKSPMR